MPLNNSRCKGARDPENAAAENVLQAPHGRRTKIHEKQLTGPRKTIAFLKTQEIYCCIMENERV